MNAAAQSILNFTDAGLHQDKSCCSNVGLAKGSGLMRLCDGLGLLTGGKRSNKIVNDMSANI